MNDLDSKIIHSARIVTSREPSLFGEAELVTWDRLCLHVSEPKFIK